LLLHVVKARGGGDGHDGADEHSDGELQLHLGVFSLDVHSALKLVRRLEWRERQ